MTLTIDIPDEAAARVHLAAGARGQDTGTFAVTVMLEAAVTVVSDVTVAADTAEFHPDEDALEAVVAAGHRAIADIEAGRLLTIEQADAALPSRLAEAVTRQRSARNA